MHPATAMQPVDCPPPSLPALDGTFPHAPQLAMELPAVMAASEGNPAMNLNRLDLASIRLIVLCARLGSLSGAASRCHLSLSAASHRLKAFEDAIGQPVFQRHHRGMRLTPGGQQIVFCSEQLLEWIERLARQARQDPG